MCHIICTKVKRLQLHIFPSPSPFALFLKVQIAIQCIFILKKFLYVLQVPIWLIPFSILFSVIQPFPFPLLLTVSSLPTEGQGEESELPFQVKIPRLSPLKIQVTPLQKISFSIEVSSLQRPVPKQAPCSAGRRGKGILRPIPRNSTLRHESVLWQIRGYERPI